MITGITTTLFVNDIDRAVSFYTQTLGLNLTGRWGNEYAAVDIGNGNGTAIGLHPPKKNSAANGGGSIQIGFTVNQPIEQAMASLKGKGVTFSGPVVDDGAVKLAFFADPDGHELYLCEVKKWS